MGDGAPKDDGPRVLYVSARYLPDRGGTEVHTHEVAQRIAAAGHRVAVLTTARGGQVAPWARDGAVPVRRLRAFPARSDLYLAPGLLRAIGAARADLVHCQGYHTLVAPLAMLACLRARTPYVLTLHSGGHSSRLRRAIRPLQAWLLRPLMARAAALVAVSTFEAASFARLLRLPLDAFTVIPSGVDLPVADRPVPTAATRAIVSVGRVEAYKGHERVVRALPAVARRHPGIGVRVLGDGPDTARLSREAERLGVAGALDVGPAGSRAELAALLRAARVVVSLSDYESQGLAVQEAVALGRRVLVSGGSALEELRRYPNVRVLRRRPDAAEVAEAVLELLELPPTGPQPLPTWDGCAAALRDLYGRVLRRP